MATQAQGPTITPAPPMFGLQNITTPFFRRDSVNGQVVDLAQSTSVTQQLTNFVNTDVITQWFLDLDLAVNAPTGTTNTASPYAPFSAIGAITTNVQNVFYPIQNVPGIDLFVKELIWPWRPRAAWGSQVGSTSESYPAVQDRLYGGDSQTVSSSSVAYHDLLPLGGAMHFDAYYSVDFASGQTIIENGQLVRRAYVGPQIMGGTNRAIFSTIIFNPIVGSNSGAGLYTVSGTQTAAASGTATLSTWREGFYLTSPYGVPAPTNWVPVYTTYPISLGNATTFTYELPKTLQVLGLVFRFYDPGGSGPVPITNVSEMKLQVGSSLVLFDDNPLTMQRRINQQMVVPNQLPEGVLVWDLAHDENGNVTNRKAINTIVTNGCQAEITMGTAMSSQGMLYVSVLGLQYVEQAAF